VRRFFANFGYQAQSRRKPRRVVPKVKWHPDELYPRVGFIVTKMAQAAERVVAFYNRRSNGSKKARARLSGPGYHAVPSPPTLCVFNFMLSPTISATSCERWRCPKRRSCGRCQPAREADQDRREGH